MKKIFPVIFALLALSTVSHACEICGCGVGTQYIGILPDFKSHVFGVRYRYSSLYSHVGAGGATTYLTTLEKYNTLEAWGGWNITRKIRMMGSIPYGFNERINQGVTTTKNGIGDIYLSAYYELLNNRRTTNANKLLVQNLWFGAGVKLPTGKYNPADKTMQNENGNLFQLGTGSTDVLLSVMYDLRLQDAGINLSSMYKINTVNKYDYEYGNKFNINTTAYYKFSIKNKLSIAPNMGVQFETAQQDLDKGLPVEVSGGNLLVGTIGVETSFKSIAIGGNFQTPLSQNLGKGIIKANNRCMVHVSFAL
ncbi:MAG TPA: transporter [Parafilimonas sp.]|nr:transporter [Parafilimonas sp.]